LPPGHVKQLTHVRVEYGRDDAARILPSDASAEGSKSAQGSLGRPCQPCHCFFHRCIRHPCRPPTIEPPMYDPYHQEREYAGEHHIAEEMRAGRHALETERSAEGKRSAISDDAPLRRRKRGRRHGPERAGRLPRNERAIPGAIAAWIPPRTKMLVTAELRDIDRARAAPVLLEQDVGKEPRRDRKRQQHQHDCAAGDEKRPLRAKELRDQRQSRGCGDERDQPGAGVTGKQVEGIVAAPEPAARSVKKEAGELEVKLRPDAEQEPDRCGNGERDGEARAVQRARSLLLPRGLLVADMTAKRRDPIPAIVATGEQQRHQQHTGQPACLVTSSGFGRSSGHPPDLLTDLRRR